MKTTYTIEAAKTVEFVQVPVGTHKGTFLGIEEGETEHGEKLFWDFQVDGYEHSLRGFVDLKDPTPRTSNKFGRWIAALANKPLEEGTTINPKEYEGRRYLLVIVPQEKDHKKTRLETFSLIEEEVVEQKTPEENDLGSLTKEELLAMLTK